MAMKERGLVKLIEECGELIQDAAKLMAYPSGTHPDGEKDLYLRLEDEIADVMAACGLVVNKLVLDRNTIEARSKAKMELFSKWWDEPEENVDG